MIFEKSILRLRSKSAALVLDRTHFMEKRSESKGLWLFFALTYGIMLLTWGLMALYQIPGGSATPGSPSPTCPGLLLFFLGGFSPSIAGVLLTWRTGGRTGLRELWRRALQFNLGWSSYGVILLLPMMMLGLRLAVHMMRGGTILASPLLTQPLRLVAFTMAMILGGAVSEEFGWRGFALDRLLGKWRPGAANMILGLSWAFWHGPLFFIPGTAQAARGKAIVELALFAAWIIPLTVVFTWLHIRTGRSLFAAVLFHATINWTNSFAGTLIRGGLIDQLTGMAAMAFFAAAAMIWWKPSRRPGAMKIGP